MKNIISTFTQDFNSSFFINNTFIMSEIKKPGIEIQLDEQVAQGNYCNLAIIAHSNSEFIVDFATMLPGLQKARVKSMQSACFSRCRRILHATRTMWVRLTSPPSSPCSTHSVRRVRRNSA